MQVQKYQHTQGSGRQLGNVQVVTFDHEVLMKSEDTQLSTLLTALHCPKC